MAAPALFEDPTVQALGAAECNRRYHETALRAAAQRVHELSVACLKAKVPAETIADITGRPVDYVTGLPAEERWWAKHEAARSDRRRKLGLAP